MPVVLAPQLKIAIWDQSWEHIFMGKDPSIILINNYTYYIISICLLGNLVIISPILSLEHLSLSLDPTKSYTPY
jgi:hypothetical protein